MATITSLNLTDTFNTFMTRVNSLISKLNTITADASTVTVNHSASAPSSGSQTNSTAILYTDSADGKLKVQSKDGSGTSTTYALNSTMTTHVINSSLTGNLPTLSNSSGVLFIDSTDNKLKVKIRDSSGNDQTYILANQS
tara:strand:+ start:5433 stop:5852 length:420 start_codon:yes stop_codon:yes gene_type:complete